MERRFLCRHCRNIFDKDIPEDSIDGTDILCEVCGSPDIMEAPTWAPLGSGLNIFEKDTWEYQCQQCKQSFKMPIPKSPAEQSSRRCPVCKSAHLHLLTISGAMPLYCG